MSNGEYEDDEVEQKRCEEFAKDGSASSNAGGAPGGVPGDAEEDLGGEPSGGTGGADEE